MTKVVLAFSGGLDTSYCVKYLSDEKGLAVHSVLVDTGGFSEAERRAIEQRAHALGVASHRTVDVVDQYYQQCLKYLVFGNVLKNNTYPLSVSAERVFQALAVAEYVKEVGAEYVAHGSTGAGNDQGLWGTSVGGKETLTSNEYLPESAFPTPLTKREPETVGLHFEGGELKGINDQSFDNPVAAIRLLSQLAAPFAIGRDIHVGDTIIGIKGRVGFEAAAPLVIIKAHHALEKHVLTKWQLYWKEQLANWYGNLLHEGQFLDPVMRNIEAFLTDSQASVTGTVRVQLEPYRFYVLGIESKFDLMSAKFGSYGEMNNAWTGDDVRGFSKILANQTVIHRQVNEGEGEE